MDGATGVATFAGASPAEWGLLLADIGLGLGVLLVLQRSGDVVWFWPLHFCLDMTQFPAVNGLA